MYHNLSAGYKFVVFSRKYSPRCAACNQLIVPDEVVIIILFHIGIMLKSTAGLSLRAGGWGFPPLLKMWPPAIFIKK